MGGVWKGRSLTLKEPFDFVLDTNVFIDMTNVEDFLSATNGKAPATWLSDPEIVYRAQRASDALGLACMFHEQQLRTYSLPESARVTLKISPRNDAGKSVFPSMFYNFVHEQLLSGWQFGTDLRAIQTKLAEGIDHGLKNEECDDLLVELAAYNKLAFITCEGVTQTGIVDQGVRRKALDRGVSVYAPVELIRARGFDAERAIAAFVDRFNAAAPSYIETFANKQAATGNINALTIYYSTILWNCSRYVV
jgi:hypothetical protein